MSDVFFYQGSVINFPHLDISQLLHQDHERLPDAIRHFVAAWCLRPELWQHPDRVDEHFNIEGHQKLGDACEEFARLFLSVATSSGWCRHHPANCGISA